MYLSLNFRNFLYILSIFLQLEKPICSKFEELKLTVLHSTYNIQTQNQISSHL